MKVSKIMMLLLVAILMVPVTGVASAAGNDAANSNRGQSADDVWQDAWRDKDNGFVTADDIKGLNVYKDAGLSQDPSIDSSKDMKFLFNNDNYTRIVNFADGYLLTIPGTKNNPKFDLGAQYNRYYAADDSYVLTVSKEDKNIYGVTPETPHGTPEGWEPYFREWLVPYIGNADWLKNNGLITLRDSGDRTDLLDGYTVTTFNLKFVDKPNLDYQYYNVAIVREQNEYKDFFLFVHKSKTNEVDVFDRILRSFKQIETVGAAKNHIAPYEVNIPEQWNEETRRFYEQYRTSNHVNWGFFTNSMPQDKETENVRTVREKLAANQSRLSSSMDYQFDIMPTYLHLGWGGQLTEFPLQLANEFAGGNGFNGKPVLQVSYQFTTDNNGIYANKGAYTPMFDILDGKFDNHFRTLAKQIKQYGKPVFIRLNNEMDSDWVSYCGLATLLDSEVFVQTWQRMYDIFAEEGVDNTIWMINGMEKSIPYSNWGDLMSYLPGNDYVQAYALSLYSMNNDGKPESFSDQLKRIYESKKDFFGKLPWHIGEFGCASGGEFVIQNGEVVYTEKGRYQAAQASWVKEMFDSLKKGANGNKNYEYASNIKGAVWFSVNDYAYIEGKDLIQNYIELGPELTDTLKEFRKGFVHNKK
ncbi:hypothetical protein FHS19_003001 [Paenibacillus rhizosphaerae]|uniref:GH26 domain-containing protein n=1 Tax=Paenibacillus rhizosphaerae TaxID=297318 RepID=A0A839TUI5_9BACL|nr:hypothetical protein [Paenibacillus rhizosphaerae]MBB3128347.1 hypothetical protein [Paenibacillus rhizosphaerae]